MDKQMLMDLVGQNSEERSKIDACRRLCPYIHDPDVLEALCREAIANDSFRVREAAIQALKEDPEAANRRFCRIARRSPNPARRRWALICLSLIACRNAKAAVLQGLNDPHRSVRTAAAFNAGLYCDPDVLNALELFFERDRPLFVMDGLCAAVKPFVPMMKRIGETCRRRLGHGELTEGPNASNKKNDLNFSSLGENSATAASIGTSE